MGGIAPAPCRTRALKHAHASKHGYAYTHMRTPTRVFVQTYAHLYAHAHTNAHVRHTQQLPHPSHGLHRPPGELHGLAGRRISCKSVWCLYVYARSFVQVCVRVYCLCPQLWGGCARVCCLCPQCCACACCMCHTCVRACMSHH